MNRERDTVDWETVLPFVAEKIPAVRREYLKRELEKRDQGLERLGKSDQRTESADQFIAGKSVSMGAVDLALREMARAPCERSCVNEGNCRERLRLRKKRQ